PYALSKASLVEAIAAVIRDRKLALLLDIRDESTKEVRIVLEIKKDADPSLVMAYLYKHTPAAELQRQHDVPPADRDAGAARPQDDAPRVPEVPPRGGAEAVRARPGGAQEAHPRPPRLRQDLRRARRGDPHHPQVRRQGGRGAEADEAVRARRPPGRRDPGDE